MLRSRRLKWWQSGLTLSRANAIAAAKLCIVNSIQGRASTAGVHYYEPFANIGDEKPS